MIPVLIIPVLNRFDLLDKSLESIDYPIDKILVINNSTEEWIPKRKDLNIHILHMPSNQGISGSWNLGIKSYPHSPWWLISSADTSFMPGSLKQFDEYSSSDRCVKSNASYSCFSLGDKIVSKVGLFDEYIYPAYYEDNDYDDRMVLAGFLENILCPGIQVDDSGGSQTIKSDEKLMNRNHYTFNKNGEYYRNKKQTGDYSVKGWDLTIRRENEWLV
jgi:GT2 family glycosyltransferase